MLDKYFEKMYKGTKHEFEKVVYDNLTKNEKCFIVTANPETFMIGTQNDSFNKVLLKESTIIVPDGVGVVKAASVLGYNVKERITGVDLVSDLLKFANEGKNSIYFFGATDEVVNSLVAKVETDYSNIEILGYKNGYIEDKDSAMEEIKKLQPDIVLVALGIPYQELLIDKYYEEFSKGIFIGVGGAFDVLSGTKKRAPEIFIKLNLEWLYRISKEPKRINRFYKSNIKYLMEIRKIRKRRNKNED